MGRCRRHHLVPDDGRNLSATLAGNQNIKPCVIWLPLQKPPDSDGSKSLPMHRVMVGNLVHPCVWRLLSSRETNIGGGARKWSSASQLHCIDPRHSSSSAIRAAAVEKGRSCHHLDIFLPCSGVAESLLSGGETMTGVGRSCRFGRKQRKQPPGSTQWEIIPSSLTLQLPAARSCKVFKVGRNITPTEISLR